MLSVGHEYLKSCQEVAEDFVSINFVTRVIQEEGAPDRQLSRPAEPEETSRQPTDELQKDKNLKRYAVERIFRYVTTMAEPLCVACKYGYSNKHGTVEPPEHLPNNSWMLTGTGGEYSPPQLNGAVTRNPALKGHRQQSRVADDTL